MARDKTGETVSRVGEKSGSRGPGGYTMSTIFEKLMLPAPISVVI